MDHGDSPMLEVGFAIDLEGSFSDLARLQQVMNSAEAKIVAEATKIERAVSGMVDLGNATAQITAFGNAVSREMQAAAREIATAEKTGEALSRQLDRQASAFGKTASEIRQMKVEAAALAAEQAGLTELAAKLRMQEQKLWDAEYAAQRRAAQEARAAAEDKAEAAARTAAAAEVEAQAIRDASFAYGQFELAARKGMAALREQQTAEAAAAVEVERLAVAAERLRAAIDPATAAQQRFDREMAEARTLIGAGSISLDEYCAKLRIEQQALDQTNAGHAGGVKNANAMKYAMQGLSYQVQDTFTQLSMGANALQVVAIQGGQAAGQFANVEGKAGAVAKFMIGPWGLAITAGALVLGPLISKLLDEGDALDQALDKLKKSAAEAEIARQAKELFSHTTEGLTAALREEKAQSDENIASLRTAAQAAYDHAQKKRDETAAIEANSLALLEAQRIRAKDVLATTISQGGQLGSAALGAAQADVARIEADIASIKKNALDAEIDFQRKSVVLGAEYGKALSTAEGRINKFWDDKIADAQRRADLFAQHGGTITSAFTLEIVGYEKSRQAALKAEQDKQKALKETERQMGRNIGLEDARRIAQSVGGVITSDHRTRAQQVALQERRRKYLAGHGPYQGPVAEPGTSLHELDQALDVAKTRGMTLKKLVDAFRAQGVKVVEKLDEGDHFHIAWGKVGQAAKAQNEAEEQAKRQAEHIALLKIQTAGLYALGDAYQRSGAAALLAAAQERAAAEVEKNGGDVKAEAARQIGLVVAQSYADTKKATAAIREQANVQGQANALVAAGLIPAGRAAEFVQDQIADLPALAAIQAAQASGQTADAAKLTGALNAQRAARAQLRAEEEAAQANQDHAAALNRIDELKLELSLIGATDAARGRALATLRATQEAQRYADPAVRAQYIADAQKIYDLTLQLTNGTENYNASLTDAADRWDIIASKVQAAGQGMADAFGNAGRALGDVVSIYAGYQAQRTRAETEYAQQVKKANGDQQQVARLTQMFALRSSGAQIAAYGDMAGAAKGFFNENSKGYKALQAAEQAFRAVQLALSIAAMLQNATETTSAVVNAGARATADGAAGVAAQAKLPFPANIAAMAATAAALVAFGVTLLGGGHGGASHAATTNTGTGTVLGDPAAQSESIKRSIDALKEVDTLMLSSSRQMAESLRSIDSQISGFAAQIVKGGDINASAQVTTGTKLNAGILALGPVGVVLSQLPIIGGILKSLFGTRTDVTGGGLYGGAQSIGSIMQSGYSAQSYSDIEKTHKFFGIVTGRSYSTAYGALDPSLNNQFTLILRSFNQAIAAAAGPLGEATDAVQSRLNSFVVDIGKISLQGLSGADVQAKLEAVFGALGDQMATYAYPQIVRFQKVGEGALETLVRVASTVETVTAALAELGSAAAGLGIDAKMGLQAQFDSLSDFTTAIDGYFQAYYSKEEQAAAATAKFAKVFDSLGLAMPSTLAGFRALVEAQDLTTAAGQATYATLIKLAPSFAGLQNTLSGAKSAADIASERADLQRQLLDLKGDTAAVRALDLAKLDPSNRALQQQIYDLQDAQAAAKAAQDLADAWKSVGDSIMDEVKRIRGLSSTGGSDFASLLGQFNAATDKARGGDQDAAKSLPGLSQALLNAAALVATSRQELDRIQAQTAASLEQTYAAIQGAGTRSLTPTAPVPTSTLLAAVANAQPATVPAPANDDLAGEIRALRDEVAQLRSENNAGHAATANNTGRAARQLENVTAASGGDAISTVIAA